MAREPVLWAHKADRHRTLIAKVFNPATGQLEPVIDPDTGLPVREKVPQRAHDGNSTNYDNPPLARMQRWMHVLRHDGHVVRMVINMAAADIEGADFVGRERRAKALFFGWIPVGMCPFAMLASGQLRPQQVVMLGGGDQAQIEDAARAARARACDPRTCSESRPCEHYIAEERARKDRQKRKQAKTDAGFQSEADRLLKGQEQQTEKIVTGVSEAMAKAFASAGGMSPGALSPDQLAAVVAEAVARTLAAHKPAEGERKPAEGERKR
jgi:hypothetical protein